MPHSTSPKALRGFRGRLLSLLNSAGRALVVNSDKYAHVNLAIKVREFN